MIRRRLPRVAVVVIVSLAAAAGTGCASFGARGNAVPSWAHTLVGTWRDSAAMATGSGGAWRFRSDGRLEWLEVRAATPQPEAVGSSRVRARTIWWPVIDEGRPDVRRICYSARPGRFGSSCVNITLESLPSGNSSDKRRLMLEGVGWPYRTVLFRAEEKAP